MRRFTEAEVERLLPMSAALEAVEASLRAQASGAALNQTRRRLAAPAGARLNAMEGAVEMDGRWFCGAKLYTTSRGGAHFTVLLWDGATGEPLAEFEADRLGQRRTGAASGIATRLMAAEDADAVGLVGAGWQAESQLEGVAAVRPVRRARIYSRSAERREAFARKMSERLGIEARAAESAAAAVEGAPIVITATNAAAPVVADAALAAGAHINAIGSNQPQRRELETETVRRAEWVVVDSVAQCVLEAGDLLYALGGDGGHLWGRVEELAEALTQKRRRRAGERTLFKSTGLAIWDVACAARILAAAS